MKKKRQLILTLLLNLVFLAAGTARAGTFEDSGIWLAAIGQGSFETISPELRKYRWRFEGQARFLDNADDFSQGIIGVDLGYAFTDDMAVWLGYAWVPTSPIGGQNFDEHRIRQQLTWSKKLTPVTLSSRTLMEQRFLENGDDTGWRFRQRFGLAHPFSFEPRFSLVGYDEVFFNLNDTNWGADSGFAQNRAFGGFGWGFDASRRIRTAIGYLNQFIRRPSADDAMNHILSINISMTF